MASHNYAIVCYLECNRLIVITQSSLPGRMMAYRNPQWLGQRSVQALCVECANELTFLSTYVALSLTTGSGCHTHKVKYFLWVGQGRSQNVSLRTYPTQVKEGVGLRPISRTYVNSNYSISTWNGAGLRTWNGASLRRTRAQ